MTTVQIRIDEKTKRNAKRVFDRLGIDMSGAIKLFLTQVSIHKGMPMQLLTENGFTIEEEREILKLSEEAKMGKNMSGPMTSKQFKTYLNSIV
jgi:DNA-damage-inducible protein J